MTAHPTSECILLVRVKPRAKRAGLLGRHGEGIKVAVRSAPERGRANSEMIELLAEALELRAGDLELVSGAGSQDKRLRVRGLSPAELDHRIDAALDASESP